MGAISALSTAGGALRRNPVLFAATFIAALLGSVSLVGQALGPLASIALSGVSLLVGLFVTPFVTGGIVGMSAEAVAGRTRFGTFVREGKENYVSFLGVTFLFIGVAIAGMILFGGIFFALAIGGGLALGASGNAAGGAAGIAGLGLGLGILLFFLVLFLGAFLVILFIQFYDVAIVVSDEGAIGSIRRSVSFVRHNIVSALGFSVIYILVSLVASIPTLFVTLASGSGFAPQDPGTNPMIAGPGLVEILPVILVTLVVSTLLPAFLHPYKVAFYTGESESNAEDSTTEVASGSDTAAAN